nr:MULTISPECIES: BamA/TamA family outer membrane protein [Myxococcaceae]
MLAAAPPAPAQAPGEAEAAEAPRGKGYEDALVAWGLAQHGRELEPSPEGKRLEEVLVSAEDVVAQSDPYPNFLNAFHWRTREHVIRREVLLEVGAPWSDARVEESVRNLRGLRAFAVVRAVAVRGRSPGGVALLIVTKDLWSLRLNSTFSVVGSLVQLLQLQPTELNFLGLNKSVAADFILTQGSLSLGQTYVDRRLFGSRLQLREQALLVFDRHTQALEGSRGSVSLSRPLYSVLVTRGFQADVSWRFLRSRIFRGAGLWQLPYPEGEPIPYAYDTREVEARVLHVSSYGERLKTDVGAGVGGYYGRYLPPPDAGLDGPRADYFRVHYLPRSEDAVYLTGSVRSYEARYVTLRDVDTYALSEDFQLGHSALVTARYAPPVLGGGPTATHYVELGASLRYRVQVGDGLSSLTVAGAVRRSFREGQPEPGGDAGWTNGRWAVEAWQASPKVLGGRFVARALLDVNVDDLQQRVSLLGGGNGLRGALVDAYAGRRVALLNLEYRTRPVVVRTVHAGGVLFWDAGSAFDTTPAPVHSVGVGLRLLFPQFNIAPFRFDLGYVLNGARPPFTGRIQGGAEQITEIRPSFLDAPLR